MSDTSDSSINNFFENIYSGMVISKKYILLTQIGKGGLSEVWMTLKISFDNGKISKEKKYCALKIQVKGDYDNYIREKEVCDEISTKIKQTEHERHINLLKHSFSEKIKDDEYFFMEMDLMGGTVYDLIEYGKYNNGLNFKIVKKIIKQTLSALHVLHCKIRYIHTDIKPDNILFEGFCKKQIMVMNIISEIELNDIFKSCMNISKSAFEHYKEFGLKIREICDEKLGNNMTLSDLDSDKKEYETTSDEETSNDESGEEEQGIDIAKMTENNTISLDDDDIIECEMKKCLKKKPVNRRTQSYDDYYYNPQIDYYKKVGKTIDLEPIFDFTKNIDEDILNLETIIDDDKLEHIKIRLTDFGTSLSILNVGINEVQSRCYRAPEVILGSEFNSKIDIWSVGCMFFELLTGEVLFNTYDETIHQDIQHLYLIEKICGPIPKKMIEKSTRGKFLYEKDILDERGWKLKIAGKNIIMDIETLLKKYLISDDISKKSSSFLEKCLDVNPDRRFNAGECFKHVIFV